MKNFMLCYDGTSQANKALSVAKMKSKELGAFLHVVFYLKKNVDIKGKDVDRMEKADQQLDDIRNNMKEDGISCKTNLIVSDFLCGEALIEYADQNNIDEIIVGIKRSSKVGKMVFGSTAQYIILRSSCPVLSVN
jgi:nucleotide-binding universal stress UspA family protein